MVSYYVVELLKFVNIVCDKDGVVSIVDVVDSYPIHLDSHLHVFKSFLKYGFWIDIK